MARVCELFGTKPMSGNTVSHANNKSRMRQLPNLKSKKYFIPELGKSMTLRLSTRAIRSIEKMGGLAQAISKTKCETLSDRLQSVKRQLQK